MLAHAARHPLMSFAPGRVSKISMELFIEKLSEFGASFSIPASALASRASSGP